MSNTPKKRENMFKKSKLRKNNRWDKFQKTINSNEEKKKPINSRFNKFRNDSEESSKFRERRSRFDGDRRSRFDGDRRSRFDGDRRSKFGERGSKFGRKRFYKSKFNKEETMDYFSKEKNSTQRNASLIDFAKKLPSKKNKKEIINEKISTKEEKLEKTTISQFQKDFILNQYMYEENTSDEEEEEETKSKSSGIIEF
jgi:hypothetical protein